MPLLFDSDYAELRDRNISFEESENSRHFVFTQHLLPSGIYNVANCDVLVEIPPNYNHAGNDMFWTSPRLQRVDGFPIPATNELGGGDNRNWNGREFCRWSRHWNPSGQGAWRPGKDDIISIYRRILWALENPDAK